MSGARLRELRVTGFKSFAEHTTVEFEAGISAVVGPNGSGKSNLADALRWALGEQGRSLRTRRAEDVIFAGSSSRRAIGMADVTLRIDNVDRLLPLDFGEVELGRRLFRSGENEYLLNRQRVRLRDLVDLLDSANLADNAFLFIGQGMVDQALALRPEERRPLFEEAAGTRRHERRRRRAEADLVESEANLERVRDILSELRPQARRLAAQAQQQEARAVAAQNLTAALVGNAQIHLVALARAALEGERGAAAARSEADAAAGALRVAEGDVVRLGAQASQRREVERAARRELDTARAQTFECRLAEARMASDEAVVERDRRRLEEERRSRLARAEEARRSTAQAPPGVPAALVEAEAVASRAVAAAAAELESLRAMGVTDVTAVAAVREREARAAEVARLRRRIDEAIAASESIAAQLTVAEDAAAAAAVARRASDQALADASAREVAAENAAAEARTRAEASDRRRAATEGQREALEGRLEAARAELAATDEALARAGDGRLARSARARGGKRVAEGLDVDPRLRPAVEAVLGDLLTASLVPVETILALAAAGTGALVAQERPDSRNSGRPSGRGTTAPSLAAEAGAVAAGGGRLRDAVRMDPGGAVTRLLERDLWVPDLAAALSVWPLLAQGWRVTSLDGIVLTDEGAAMIGTRSSLLELAARRDALRDSAARLERELDAGNAALEALRAADADLREGLARQIGSLEAARRDRRVAEEADRVRARALESAARDVDWERSGRDRLATEIRLLEESLRAAQGDADEAGDVAEHEASAGARGANGEARAAVAVATARVASLAQRREAVAQQLAAALEEQRAAQERRQRVELELQIEERGVSELDAELLTLAASLADAGSARAAAQEHLSLAADTESRIASELDEMESAATDELGELTAAEGRQATARERLRIADGASRAAEVALLETRFARDTAREQLLGELATVEGHALHALEAPQDAGLETALDAALDRWTCDSPSMLSTAEPAAQPMSPQRLASLRRRYHELGASNPFAAEEYAEVSDRLATLEAQHADLETAIRSTRELIVALSARITVQFRETFAALESAFGRRFRQLFDGGEAELSLTDPENLSTTGVEITARPPGKKRQPLSMLSGGERALTAVALLMAMLEVRPVPFCVLDEVDAALDEANIGRFSAALRSLAETIQFIVITHNRGTIEAADALYGVTVDDDAVSRVVSLRLADVESFEARSPVGSIA